MPQFPIKELHPHAPPMIFDAEGTSQPESKNSEIFISTKTCSRMNECADINNNLSNHINMPKTIINR